ncbi:MAG TPA: RagB/SusD family nutrient uptake outer membrane protein [Puia sp.]|nr:RagB/SusD family nutrient uptake outer membrane protein [Puia sp.]
MANINITLNKMTLPAFIHKMVLIFLIASVTPSCKKVMDKEPLNSYSDAIVWQNATLISDFVSSTYRGIPTGGFGGLPVYLACFTDEGKVIGEGIDAIFNGGNITPSNVGGTPLDYWTAYYGVIGKCNLFLDRIKASAIDATLKSRMTGEIRVIRAYSYFSLISFYGGVPLISKPLTLADSLSLSKTSYDDCMTFVIAELDAAAALLPSTYAAADQGRITKGAALAIKSRALLYAASPQNNSGNDLTKWQKAADAAKAIIDLNTYSLYPNYKNLFLQFTAYNPEIIWQRPYNNIIDFELAVEVALYPPGSNGRSQLSPIHNIVADYETRNGLLPANDPSFNPQNPYVNRDPRMDATILFDSSLFKGRRIQLYTGGLDADIPGSTTPRPGYYLRKFNDTTITDPITTRIGNTPWTFFRYAEILLNYAEAKYYLGDEATCRTYINLVRSRPGVLMPAVTETGDALLKRLQHERRIELAFEGHRYFDVRRWKIAPTVLNINVQQMTITKDLVTGIRTFTVKDMLPVRAFFDKNYLLPIPQTEIDRDRSLIQNTGY